MGRIATRDAAHRRIRTQSPPHSGLRTALSTNSVLTTDVHRGHVREPGVVPGTTTPKGIGHADRVPVEILPVLRRPEASVVQPDHLRRTLA